MLLNVHSIASILQILFFLKCQKKKPICIPSTEKYFDMKKVQCKEGLDIYKKFLTRMTRISEFLKVAEVIFSCSSVMKIEIKMIAVVTLLLLSFHSRWGLTEGTFLISLR